jgi:hypothetical protein
MINSSRTSELIVNTELTPEPGEAGYVDPPTLCNLCLQPATSFVPCDEFTVPESVIVDASFENVSGVSTIFSDHAHTETAGPPEVHKCFYTGATVAHYCQTTGTVVDIDISQYWQMSWNAGAGILTCVAEFTYEAGTGPGYDWYQPYSLTVLDTTYSSWSAFVSAINTELARQVYRTLTAGTPSGTEPSSLNSPATIRLFFA